MTVRINETIYTMYFLTYVKDRYAFADAFLGRGEKALNDYSISDREYINTKVFKSLSEKEAIIDIAKLLYPNDSFIVESEYSGYAIWGLRKEYADDMD